METLVGSVENVVYYNRETGYTVLEIDAQGELVTVVGELGDINEGEEVTLHGMYTTHANFGRQFRASMCEVSMPESVTAIRRYLAGGALPYIGRALAGRIVDAFGEDTLEIIAQHPGKLGRIKGIGNAKAATISQEFRRIFGVREAIAYLAGMGMSSSLAIEMYKHYGPHTVQVISKNPYVLCGYPAYQPFAAVDAVAANLSMEHDAHERICAGLLYVLRHNLQNGHTCLPKGKLVQTVAAFISVEPERVNQTLESLVEQEELYEVQYSDKYAIYLPDLLQAERNIAAHFQVLMALPAEEAKGIDRLIGTVELASGIRYAPLQRKAIADALQARALVLTGGPGTGKTTTVNGMLAAFEHNGERVALAAPTGRAAKRLSELTGRKAKTIHRLLEVDYSSDNVVRFLHHEKNMLKCDVVVVDEMSMVDVQLFESLLRALKPACKVIMVGDEDQLPSVGPGNVLGSIMASGVVPVVRLTEIFRQAAESKIVSNAHHIVAGEPLESGGRDSDFFFLEAQGEACQELVCDLVCRRLPQSYGFDPFEDIQVLCPTKMGALGTAELNRVLQQRLNPPAPGKNELNLRDKILREGDKVMQVRNNYDIPYTRPEGGEDGAGAFNGDMGVVERVDVQEGSVTVRSEDRLLIYSSEHVRELEPAYAVTIHKSQGSEFAAVIIPLWDTPQKLLYRNLLYTGVTRAKQLCILTGEKREATQMIHNVKRNLRFSKLADMMRENVQ